MSNYNDDLTVLLEREHFWRYVSSIHEDREAAIGMLRDCDTTDKLHQVSGRIQALDDILMKSGWPIVKKKLQTSLL